MTEKTQVKLYLTDDARQRLRAAAERNGLSMSSVVQMLIVRTFDPITTQEEVKPNADTGFDFDFG